MDRLSSCYFCGAALDGTLTERPVVPSSLHAGTDTQKTVVLCGTCQRKLDAVLDTVVDAVEEASTDRVEHTDGENKARTTSDTSGGDGDLESTLGDDEDILRPLGGDGDAGRGSGEASEMEFGDERARTGGTDSDGAATDGPTEAETADDTDGESAEPRYTDSRGAGFRREDDGPSGSRSLTGGAFDGDDEDETDSPSERTAGSPSESAAETGESTDDAESGTDDTDRSPDVTVSRLENTKVMRLLKNREFPVDRDEFVTVAANAYQISRDDCERVIDLAVEHGLLREESGQLYGGA